MVKSFKCRCGTFKKLICLQELFHPRELRAMVVGNENYDFHEMEKVCF